MRVKRTALYAAAAAAEIILLLVYFRTTRVAVSAAQLLESFSWTTFHGAFEPALFLSVWGMAAAGAVIAAIWLGLAWAAGAAWLDRLGFKAETSLQQALIAVGLGLGAESLAMFFLCALHLARPAAALLLGLCMAAAAAGARLRRPQAPSWRTLSAPENEPLVLAGLLAAALLVFHLMGALVPPSSFDEMDYQLSLPKLYAINGGFVATPYSHFSFFPKNINLLFMLGLLSGGVVVAKLLALALACLCTLALYAFTSPQLGARAAGFAAAVFFFTPVIGNQFRVAAPDLGTAYLELIGLFLLLRWLDARLETTTLLLSSVFWGLALGAKYTALPDFAVCFLALAWFLRKDGPRAAGRVLLRWTLPALLLWSPWLVKNFLASGNPINPIFSTVLTSRNFFFAGRYKATVDYSVGLGIPNYFPVSHWRDALLMPWRLIVEHNDYNHDLGPVWLLLLALAPLSLKRRPGPWLGRAALLCVLAWAWWLALSIHITRYFAAGLALSSLLAGWLLDAVPEDGGWRWALLLPVFLAWFQQATRMVYIQNVYKKPWGYLAGRCALGEYLGAVQTDSPFDAFEFLNQNTPAGARVLLFNEFRTFYLDRDFLASTPWDHDYWLEMLRESKTPEDLLSRLKELRIDYFLANDSFRRHQTGLGRAEDWSAEDLAKEKVFLRRVMDVVFVGAEHVWVAKVKDRAA